MNKYSKTRWYRTRSTCYA